MNLKRIISSTLIASLVLMAVTAILLFTLDLGFLRGTLERQVQQATGRDFSIDRNVSIRLGRELVISAQGVRLGNPAWADEEDLINLDQFDAVISTRSLWSGPLQIIQLSAVGAKIHLQQNTKHQANWVFSSPSTNKEPTDGRTILIDEVSVTDLAIDFQSPRLDRPLEANIDSVQLGEEADGKIHIRLDGQLNSERVVADAALGTRAQWLRGRDIEIQGSGAFGDITVSGTSLIDDIQAPLRPAIDLQIAGPEFKELTDMLGIGGLGEGDLAFSAVTRTKESMLETEISGNFGEFEMDIKARMPSLQDISDARLEARLSGPNFGRVARLLGEGGWPAEAFEVDAQVHRSGELLRVDRFHLLLAGAKATFSGKLPVFPDVSGAELELQVNGPDLARFQSALGIEDLPAGRFSVAGTLKRGEGESTIIDIEYGIPLASGSIRGTLGSGKNLLGSKLITTSSGNDATDLAELTGFPGFPASPWTAHISIGFEDPSYHELSDATFTADGLSLSLNGRIGADSIDTDTDVKFSVKGDRLSDFQYLAGDGVLLPERSFTLSGKATAMPDAWQLQDVSFAFGTTKLDLDGLLGKDASLAGTDLFIRASGTETGKMLDLPGQARFPDGPFTFNFGLDLDENRLRLKQVEYDADGLDFDLDADIPWPLDLSRGQFHLRGSGNDITRTLPELAGMDFDSKAFEIVARGSWQDGKISIAEGNVQIASTTLSARGTLDLPPDVSATDFHLELHSPDLSRLGTVDGNRWGTLPVDLSTAFSGTDSNILMDQFEAQIGNSKIEGDFELNFNQEIPRFDLRLSTDFLNLRPLLTGTGEGAEADRKPAEKGARLIPDWSFPITQLASVEGRFSILADRVHLNKATLQNYALTGEVRNGGLFIEEAGIDGYSGRLSSTLSLEPEIGGSARLATRIHGEEVILNLAGLSGDSVKDQPAFNVDINLQATGLNLREAASKLNGSININSPGGQVRNVKEESLSALFLYEVIAAISPSAARQDTINISCFAAAIDVQNGAILLDPGIAVQSDKLNVFASGKISLDTEKLDVGFRSQTRKAVDVSASELVSPYVKLSGTLANPSVALDPKGTLLSGGAAFLSGGLSILAKKALDQISGTKDPCAEYLASGEGVE